MKTNTRKSVAYFISYQNTKKELLNHNLASVPIFITNTESYAKH